FENKNSDSAQSDTSGYSSKKDEKWLFLCDCDNLLDGETDMGTLGNLANIRELVGGSTDMFIGIHNIPATETLDQITTIYSINNKKHERKEETSIQKPSADEDVEEIEPFHIVGGNIN
ncbi:hypothetical protein STEG23_016990, partial [Scotinomys teguina]